jgi:hypothetical protein
MDTAPSRTDTLTVAIPQLSLAEVEQCLADLDVERAALALLRRSEQRRPREVSHAG